MKAPALPLWKLTRTRYDRMVGAGIFGPEDRVELLDGLLIAREPQGGLHAMAVGLVSAALERAFGKRHHVRQEKPVALDLVDEVLEVYRDPVCEPSRGNGWKYANSRLLERTATINPLAAPRARIRVASLLP